MSGQAFLDPRSGETTETGELRGRIAFRHRAGAFEVPHVAVEFAYDQERYLRWAIHLAATPASLAGMMPLLAPLGLSSAEVLNLPADQHLELALAAKPAVLARLSPELMRVDTLSAAFQAGGDTLLDLDNYEQATCRIVSATESAGTF